MANAPILGTGLPGQMSTAVGTGSFVDAFLLKDGRILGSDEFGLFMRKADGSMDTSFGSNGRVAFFSDIKAGMVSDVQVQADGSILVAGNSGTTDSQLFVARYKADGSADTSFGIGGRTTFGTAGFDQGAELRIQADGKIVMVGTRFVADATATYGYKGDGDQSVLVARLNADGSMDKSFGTNGLVESADKGALAVDFIIQADGGIVVAADVTHTDGERTGLLRFKADGSVDTSWGTAGVLTIDQPSTLRQAGEKTSHPTVYPAIAQTADGKILLAMDADEPGSASWTPHFAFTRLLANGSVDTSYGDHGWTTPKIDFPTPVTNGLDLGFVTKMRIALKADGSMVAMGSVLYIDDNGAIQYMPVLEGVQADGKIDTSFGINGQQAISVNGTTLALGRALLVGQDGNLLMLGSIDAASDTDRGGAFIARLDASGNPITDWVAKPVNTNAIDYTQGRPDAVLNSGMAVYDADNMALAGHKGNYAGSTLVIARSGGANAADNFLSSGSMHFKDGHVTVDDIDVGSVAIAGGTLTIKFNSSATGLLVNKVLSQVAYEDNAFGTDKQVNMAWTFSDGAQTATASTAVTLHTAEVAYWIDSLIHLDESTTTYAATAALYRSLLGAGQSIVYHFFRDPIHGIYNNDQKAAAEAAMAKIAAVANITFSQGPLGTSNAINIHNALDNPSDANVVGQGTYPNAGGRDLWAPLSQGAPDSADNAMTLVHELGHNLGLKHPFDYQSEGAFLPAGEDNSWATVMSYNTHGSYYDPSPLDVAALQYLYGPSKTVRMGDDTYMLKAPDDSTARAFDNFLWDSGGNDTISGANLSQDITLYLDPGKWGFIGQQRGNLITDPGQLTVNYNSVFENAIGGKGNDTLVGNSIANQLSGGDGNDTLQGGGGNDGLDGGAGLDTAAYVGNHSGYIVSYANKQITVTDKSGAEGQDLLSNIEYLKFADGYFSFDTSGGAGQVYRLYQAVFGRAPEAQGLGFWLNAMSSGFTLTQVANGFQQSQEFLARFGSNVTNETFLTKVYENVLHREPDAAGLAWWMGHFNDGSVTRDTAIIGFSESPENIAQVIGVIQNGMQYLPYHA